MHGVPTRCQRFIGGLILCFGLGMGAAHAQPAPPDWAADAVWYQIFPERFANGDPSNDPTVETLEFPENVDADLWAITPWTADWYRRAEWETARGDDFYEDGVFDRRLGGDLQGVLDRVDYLDSLGVTAVYFNPIFHAASLHKYDASSYHHVDPYLGPDPEGDLALMATETADPATWKDTAADRLFFELVDAFRQRDIRVILDGVFNHTGTRFWAFADIAENQQASPYADWYEVTAWDDPATPENEFDWEGWFGYKPLAVLSDNADGTDLHPEVKAHVFDATRRWMDPNGDGDPSDGIDGWRLDVATEVPDAFWRDWTAYVREMNPEALTIAEEWGDAREYLERTDFHSTMNYHAFIIPLDEFAFDHRMDASAFVALSVDRFNAYPEPTRLALMNVLGSHDTDRLASMIVNGELAENYDRGVSPRYTPEVDVRAPNAAEREVQRAVVTLQMAMPGAPHIYYGDEAGMWGADDPDDRKPMVWPDLTYETETRHPLGQDRQPDPIAFDADLFGFYQSIIAHRTADPVLRRGELAMLAAEGDVIAFSRQLDDAHRVVAFNRGDDAQFIELPRLAGRLPAPLKPVFASSGDLADVPSLVVVMDDASSRLAFGLRIPARTTVIFEPVQPDDIRPYGLDE